MSERLCRHCQTRPATSGHGPATCPECRDAGYRLTATIRQQKWREARAEAARQAEGPVDLSWQERAACAGESVDLFFPDINGRQDNIRYAPAKAICQSCPVQLDCLRYAQANDIGYGLWGGLTARERGTYRRRVRYSDDLALGSRTVQ